MLDSNVLISAAIRPSGIPGRVLASFVEHEAFRLVLSPHIVDEVERAFRSKRLRRYLTDLDDSILFLIDVITLADLVPDTTRVTGVCRDPDDDRVLSTAMEGRADVVVTGDEDLLALKAHEGIAIVSPRSFLNRLRARSR